MKLLTIKVNGIEQALAVKPNATLLDVLREQLGFTGTKRGCELGDCGACTVLVDGEPAPACLTLAVRCEGKEITTVEGLAKNGELSRLQKSFVENGALQCGYCTPGMLMTATAFLRKNPNPTDAEIRNALGGNLCRCTGYQRIVKAISGGSGGHDAAGDSEIGKSVPRVDAFDKVTGRAKYTDDIALPGMIYARTLYSTIPHGKIVSIDTTEAEKIPGVFAVITGKDVPDVLYGVSPARYDEYVLCKEKVRYVGDRVAVVAAVDEETAENALKLIKVEYEKLPAVFDPFEGSKPGAPQLHEKFPGNVNTEVRHHFGDVEKGFVEADHVREETFIGNHSTHAPIETHCAIAQWEGDGTLVVTASTQAPHYLQYQMSRVFQMPMGKIRIVRPVLGGGFGGKADPTFPAAFCAAILSRKTGKPVKMRFTRKEVFTWHRGRHKMHVTLKIGVKKNGKITAVQNTAYVDGGAYTSFGIISTYYAGSMLPTLYHIPNYKYDGYRIYTNKPACGAMRGNGAPQPRYAFECMLNMIADDLKIDPMKIRRINGMDANTYTLNSLDIKSCEFKKTLYVVETRSAWKEKYGKLPRGKGIGVGCGGFVSGAGYPIYRSKFPHSNAIIRIIESGDKALCFIAAAEIGQGSDTVLAQICAEALGISAEDVKVLSNDAEISPLDLGSYSSRVTLMAGNAVVMAAEEVKRKVLEFAAKMLKCDSAELVAKQGKITGKIASIPWSDAAKAFFSERGPLVGTGFYSPPEGLGGPYKGAAVGTSPAYSFGSSVCEVSVDLDTGKVKVEKVYDCHDCGTPINPMSCHGQVEGSVVMGASEAILEGMVFLPSGELKNSNFHEYLMMTAADSPEVESELVESYEERGPYGAKEIGEGAILPAIPAVIHAIANATGVWIKELPLTPEKILRALNRESPTP